MKKAPVPLEHDVQDAIVRTLHLNHYDVMVTTAFRQKGASGVQKGVPDLLVGHKNFGPGVLVGLEVKRPGPIKWSSHEQQLNWLKGLTIVVQCPQGALDAVQNKHGIGSRAIHARDIYTEAERNHKIADLHCKIVLEKQAKRVAKRRAK